MPKKSIQNPSFSSLHKLC